MKLQIFTYDIFPHPFWIAFFNMHLFYANLGNYHEFLMPVFPIRKKNIKRNWYYKIYVVGSDMCSS